MSLDGILARLEENLQVPSVTGDEHDFIAHLRETIPSTHVVHDVMTDRDQHSSMLVSPRKKAAPQVLIAHVDRNGLWPSEEGETHTYAAAAFNHDFNDPWETAVAKRKNIPPRYRWRNVVGAYDGERYLVTQAWLDVQDVPRFTLDRDPGTQPLAFASNYARMQGRVRGQLDNALGVAVLQELVADGYEGTVLFVGFEEAGRSFHLIDAALQGLGHLDPSVIDLDVTPVHEDAWLDQGYLALRRGDAFAPFPEAPRQDLERLAGTLGIPTAYKGEPTSDVQPVLGAPFASFTGKTQIGRLLRARPDVDAGTLQIPVLNYHTNDELASEKSIQSAYTLLTAQAP